MSSPPPPTHSLALPNAKLVATGPPLAYSDALGEVLILQLIICWGVGGYQGRESTGRLEVARERGSDPSLHKQKESQSARP